MTKERIRGKIWVGNKEDRINDYSTIARSIYKLFNQRDLDAACQLATEDVVIRVIPFDVAFYGRHGFREYMWILSRAFSDVSANISKIIATDESLVTELLVTGTHDGTLIVPTGEIPATGRSIEYPIVEVWDLRDGKMAELRSYFDAATLLQQLGQ